MKRRVLTLIIIIHSQFESVEFFHNLIKTNNFDKNKILFAFDSKIDEIPMFIMNIIEKNKYDFFCLNKNIGKLNLVIKASEKIQTRFFKIIDQDDSIYFPNFELLERKISNIKEDILIRHKATKINSKNNKLFNQSLDKNIILKQIKSGYSPQFVQGTNCDVIYPTKIIRMMLNLELTRQEFHNDILLSNFVYGITKKSMKINVKFYIQFHKKGQTRKISIERSNCIPELYKNYEKISKHFKDFDFKKIMSNSYLLHTIYIKNFTTWYLKKEYSKTGKNNYIKSKEILYRLRNEN